MVPFWGRDLMIALKGMIFVLYFATYIYFTFYSCGSTSWFVILGTVGCTTTLHIDDTY